MYQNKDHERPEFGQRVKAPDHLVRRKGSSCKWMLTSERYPGATKPTPVEGFYIGWRTLSDGWYDLEDGAYCSQDRFEGWLVVYDPRKKPVFVRPEDCRTVGEK